MGRRRAARPRRAPRGVTEEIGARAGRVPARVEGALAEDAGDVVLVAHAHFPRVLTARRLGLPPAEGRLFQLATGTVGRLSTEHGRPVITEWNRRRGL